MGRKAFANVSRQSQESFARQFKLVERDEQLKYLNGRMAEIFKKDGFPQDFVDEILGKVEVKGE